MCGLAGLARFGSAGVNDLSADAEALLRRMAGAVRHRGPDDERFLISGRVGLAFSRLSLVDVTGGGQPLSDDDGSVVLIANGEIYNHHELAATLPAGTRLRTQSDCEVLIHLYLRDGLRFLDQVRGMFAIVLWDRRNERLVFARDRFGIKPLFYHQTEERVVFGSEMKVLFEDPACPRQLDWAAALRDPVVTSTPMFSSAPVNTWFRDIGLVEAGTILSFDLRSGDSTSHRYWRMPDYTGDGLLSENEFVRRYRELLSQAVTDCGMADVPIGLFLSGGIDSAAVAALSTQGPLLRTFTALNASTLTNGDAEYGNRIAGMLGLPNFQILLDARQTPSPAEWKHLVWLLESPICGPEIYYKHYMYNYVRLTHPDIKAMLLGAGSDEFNGGYSRQMAGGGDWRDFRANLRSMASRRWRYADPDLAAWWEHSSLPLLRDDVLGDLSTAGDPYVRYFHWKYRAVLQYNCWHEDRTAAGNGIESRVPFLDHRLIELVAAVPESLRQRLVWDKRILREAVRGLLPDHIVDRPKNPFFYGEGVGHTYRTFARMLLQQDGALLEEALSGPQAKAYVDADNLRELANRIMVDPTEGHIEFLLHVVNLGLLEQLAAAPPAAPAVSRIDVAPVALEVADWDTEEVAIHQATIPRAQVDPERVLKLADNVLLLRERADPVTWYVSLDGSVEFVIDDATPGWGDFLSSLDGVRTVREIARDVGLDLSSIAGLLAEAADLKMFAPAPSADAARGQPAYQADGPARRADGEPILAPIA